MGKKKLRSRITLAASASGGAQIWSTTETEAQRKAKNRDYRVKEIPFNGELGDAEIVNPHGSEDGEAKVIDVSRSLRDDPLARMFCRRQIDRPQYEAGRKWQGHYEIAQGCGASAIDPTKEAVDGGRIPEPFTDAKKKAHLELIRACRIVGQIGESLLRDVLAERLFMHQVAAKRGQSSQRAIDGYAKLFQIALEALAVEWGFANGSHLATISRQGA